MNEAAGLPETTAIRVEADGGIGRITLARPEKLNALNRAALEELARVATWFDTRSTTKVVVVQSEGRAFSAGFDLDDRSWSELGPPEVSAEVGRAMAEAVGAMRAITIASIRSHCIGGGVVLAAACDLRVAAENAAFRIPEVDLGIPLFWTGISRLAREIGPALTKELVLTGRTFSAREAQTFRFVNRVVANDALDAETDALAREIAGKAALVVRTTKQQVEDAVPAVPAGVGGSDVDTAGLAEAFADPEAREAAARYRQPS